MAPEEQKKIASSRLLVYSVNVMDDFLVLHRDFPPKTVEIRYNEIASVEHKSIIDYGLLPWAAVSAVLAYAFFAVEPAKKVLEALLIEIKMASGAELSSAEYVSSILSYLLVIIAAYYFTRFFLTLPPRLAVYRSGRGPILIPMGLTGDSLKVLEVVSRKVKESEGVTREEVEKFIGEQIRTLFDERARMQQEIISVAKKSLREAQTVEEKERVKKALKDGVVRLRSQDEIIDRELKKTGLNKDDLYKKYRIQPPDEAFIDALFSGSEII
jgi:hypothetical protein